MFEYSVDIRDKSPTIHADSTYTIDDRKVTIIYDGPQECYDDLMVPKGKTDKNTFTYRWSNLFVSVFIIICEYYSPRYHGDNIHRNNPIGSSYDVWRSSETDMLIGSRIRTNICKCHRYYDYFSASTIR